MDGGKLVCNVRNNQTHSFQHGGVQIGAINSSGLYIGSNLLSSSVLGYLNTCTSDLQAQLNTKVSVSYLPLSGGTMTGDITTSRYVKWSNQYG